MSTKLQKLLKQRNEIIIKLRGENLSDAIRSTNEMMLKITNLQIKLYLDSKKK